MTQPGKKETLLAYLERGIAMLHLDARRPGVRLPEQHKDDPHLRLNLSYRYGIPDLRIDDDRVQASLSFRGRTFQCVVPWSAVFGVTSQATGEGQVWPEDLPSEVMSALAHSDDPGEPGGGEEDELPMPTHKGAALAGQRPRKRPAPARKKPALVAIDGAAPAPKAEAEPAAKKPHSVPAQPAQSQQGAQDDAPPETPRKSHLRLVR